MPALAPLLALGSLTAIPRYELSWQAPDTCPTHAEVVAAVDTALAGGTGASDRLVRAHARVETTPDGSFALALSIDDGLHVGERSLVGGDCRELADAAALVVALAIDPSAAPVVLAPAPEPPTSPAPVPPPPPTQPATDRPAPAPTATPGRKATSPPRLGLRLALAGGGAFGLVGAAAGALSLSFGIVLPHLRLDVYAHDILPRTLSAPADGRVEGRFQVFAAGLRLCPRFSRPRVELLGCVGAAGGFVHGRGVGGLTRTDSAVGPLALLEAGPALAIHLHARVALRFDALVVVPLPRQAFATAPSGEIVMRLGPAAGLVLAGLDLRLR